MPILDSFAEHTALQKTTCIYTRGLAWWIDVGYGFLQVEDPKEDYFEYYRSLEATQIGIDLNRFRSELVRKYMAGGKVLDVGIGDGAFMRAAESLGINAVGFDVDAKSIDHLKESGAFCDPYVDGFDGISAVTMWDSLEHVQFPEVLLSAISHQMVFVSIPIFRDLDHVLKSKHFKPNEHWRYFTRDGFRAFMQFHGFSFVSVLDGETQIGREDILTFVCQRPVND
jgi:hypothetical protein